MRANWRCDSEPAAVPIREALRALEESRLVRSEKNRGVFVREISVAEADEIYDMREALDQLIGQRVAERATPEQLRDLRPSSRRWTRQPRFRTSSATMR